MSSFHPISLGARTFNEIGPGVYSNSAVVYGGPTDELKISPGRESKNGTVNASISRHIQKDVVIAGITRRVRLSCIMQIQAEPGFTVSEIDDTIGDVSDFAAPGNLDRILLGAS